ncbi:hypothetical protein GGQ74_000232 [Desulfobaculum xiamenense]|uniref:Uncharacterized protein n=1 Tax=Desulfobaculum xiamenense TaxID=995050 RepID=A0A846QJD8_9BACT|nr:hypothetical protein [Desulfobaculum xiamenense]NJB66592.1 hypothetical protein [Desulfobaculum xiamenense]
MSVPDNFVNVVTNSGARMTKTVLMAKVRTGTPLTHTDASAASVLWAQKIADQYPDFIGMPRKSVIAAEHLIGLVRDLMA